MEGSVEPSNHLRMLRQTGDVASPLSLSLKGEGDGEGFAGRGLIQQPCVF